MRRRFVSLLGLALLLAALPARADMKPHALFSDGMVLQQGVKCPVWGTSDDEEVVVPVEVVMLIGPLVAPVGT